MKKTEKNCQTNRSENPNYDLSQLRVVESNTLIECLYNANALALKMFAVAIAQIDRKNVPADNTVCVSKALLFGMMRNSSSSSKYTRLHNALESMHQQTVIKLKTENNNGKVICKVISPIEQSSFNEYSDTVTIKFSNAIMPFISNLENNFTQYTVDQIANLTSKYSLSFFKRFTMCYNQYEKNKSNPLWSKTALDKLKNPVFSVSELRAMFGLEKNYKSFGDFEKRVLKESIAEINEHTLFEIKYEKIKEGHSINKIQFKLTRKAVAPVPYKEEQGDEIYLESKNKKIKEEQKNYSKAIENQYTKMLVRNLLIGSYDLLDTKMMSRLQKRVYPLYDHLKNLRGIQGVGDHLLHVSRHQEDYSKKNCPKYLEKSIVDYLATLGS